MKALNIKQGYVHADYISVSYGTSDTKDNQLPVGLQLASDKARLLNIIGVKDGSIDRRIREVARFGYKGYVYQGVFVGSREGRRLEHVAGGYATEWCLPKQYDHSSCTFNRFDVAVDLYLCDWHDKEESVERTNDEIDKIVATIMPFNERLNRQVTRVTSSGGGYTVYVGSRASDRMLRIYNKTVQADLVNGAMYPCVVRIELELKGRTVAGLHYYAHQGTSVMVESVVHHFASFGIQLLNVNYGIPFRQDKSDWIDTRMAWLKRTVSSSVLKLLDVVPTHQVLQAIFGDEWYSVVEDAVNTQKRMSDNESETSGYGVD